MEVDVSIPASQPGCVSASKQRAAFVSFSALPDPDRVELQQHHAAIREERTKKTNRYGKKIAASGSGNGRTDCDRNVNTARKR